MTPATSKTLLVVALLCMGLALPASALGQVSTSSGAGGMVFTPPPPPPKKAKIVNGVALAPAAAPARVKRAIEAGNRLISKPYRYGGGHKPFSSVLDTGYDCSGSVSYALYGGRFLKSPLPSGSLMSWGEAGPGRWITVYAHGGHAYVVIAGLRFDTSMRDPDAPGPGTGPRWSKTLRTSAAFVARHPLNY
ncbi:MAG TPA: hypothetical protein VI111_09840 [Thermoleophilaceae bacterium]